MEAIFAFAAIAAYFTAPIVMEHLPTFGYLMTWPLRLALPICGYGAAGDDISGVLTGAGLAFIMSFESMVFWKVGVACMILSSVCL